VVKTPASVREETIPAEYKSVTTRVPVQTEAATREIDIPAEYQTVTKRRLVKAGGFTEWREVLCGSEVSGNVVRQVQEALKAKGYNPGPIDGIMGAQTKAAMVKYQQDKGLPVGSMDFETLKSLGISY
jgi:His-Xaa-Ser repeat protein HxsA